MSPVGPQGKTATVTCGRGNWIKVQCDASGCVTRNNAEMWKMFHKVISVRNK